MDANELETYQVQLSQVELALTQDPTNAELASLRTELSELIELTKAALAGPSNTSTSTTSNKKQPPGPPNGTAAANGGKVWAAGDECLAKYSGDEKWYPARITTVSGAATNRVYTVIFRGYNNTEQLKASEIKSLPPSMANSSWDADDSSGTGKRKARVEDEQSLAEKERKKKKNEKKLETRAAKAKEQNEKQASWQKFAKKSEKKGIHIAGVAGTSIFKTPDNPLGKVGVTGSGKGMTENRERPKNKFVVDESNPAS